MTDARYPERWLNDKRLVRLSDSAHRTFVMVLTWSVANRTDGFFDADDVAYVPHAKGADFPELATAGVLTRKGAGWMITLYDGSQTSAAQLAGLERARQAEREKKARQRAHNADDHSLCRPDTCGVVPRDVPRDQTGGTHRTGQDRPKAGQEGEQLDHESDPRSGDHVVTTMGPLRGESRRDTAVTHPPDSRPTTACSVCGTAMSSAMIWAGETTHPMCAA